MKNFLYSNLGYVLLGQLIEKYQAKAMNNLSQITLFSKLGLQPGELGFTINDFANNVTGYQKNWTFMNLLLGFFLTNQSSWVTQRGKWKPFKAFYINGSSYGGLIGTASSFQDICAAAFKNK